MHELMVIIIITIITIISIAIHPGGQILATDEVRD
jgi:hypothetical protein